jgi:hypothetical protein
MDSVRREKVHDELNRARAWVKVELALKGGIVAAPVIFMQERVFCGPIPPSSFEEAELVAAVEAVAGLRIVAAQLEQHLVDIYGDGIVRRP